jgi:hypothetical protein
MSISNLTPTQLRQAASIIEQIEKLQNQLNKINGVKAAAPAAPAAAKPAKKARKKISAAGIARIRAAQKLRWAKIHAAKKK